MHKKILCVLFLLSFANVALSGTEIKANLNQNWEFLFKDKWYSTTVPNSIHTDLFNNNLIEDPFYADNETKLQWIGQQDWEYKTVFDVTDEILEKQVIELNFKGLDTYATVYLNGRLIVK